MRIRPRADPGFTVNLVTADRFLIERLALFCKANPHIHILCSDAPRWEADVDAFAVPARMLLAAGESYRCRCPGRALIAYGESELLTGAFLAGCDDYLKDPWEPQELACRLERMVRVRPIRFDWGELSLEGMSIQSGGRRCALSVPEHRILQVLLRHRGQVVPREVLYYAIWGKPSGGRSRAVDVHVSRLRRKLVQLSESFRGCIRSLRGTGYLMD